MCLRVTFIILSLLHRSLLRGSYADGNRTLLSVVSMNSCIRNFAKFTGCGLGHAVKCATFNPAKYVVFAFFFRCYFVC